MITINGIRYDTDALQQGVFQQGEPWELELSDFLKEWFNSATYITSHTSGSTGTPKEIKLLKEDMLASARITNDFFDLNASSRLLLCLPPTYIAGKMLTVRALAAGAELIAIKPSGLPDLPEQPVDLAAMVPMQAEEILKSAGAKNRLNTVKQLLIGGAPVSAALNEALQSVSTLCYATYGMTETVSHIALKQLNGRNPSGNYFALGNVCFETDERNCLVIHAPHLQQQCFVTNDLVHLQDARHFEWIGRYDHIINSGGLKFSPESIEKKLTSLISKRFFITSLPDPRLGEKITLVIEDSPWNQLRQLQLRQDMQPLLSVYETPKSILFRCPFKETYSGKVVRTLEDNELKHKAK